MCQVRPRAGWGGRTRARYPRCSKGATAAPTRPHVIAESYLADGKPGGHGDPFRAADWTYPRDSINLSIRTPRVRYVFRSHDEDELYDLVADPHEQVNQAAAPAFAELRRECRRTLAQEIDDVFPNVAARLCGDPGPDAAPASNPAIAHDVRPARGHEDRS